MADREFQVRMPLFDRLVDRDRFAPREVVQMRALGREGVRESVRRELEQLFNTRCPVPAHQLSSRPRTVLDYGIPDFSMLSARKEKDRFRLAAILREAIAAYEPRLANVRVTVSAVPADDFKLAAEIEADLVVDDVPEPVLFTTALQTRDTTVEVR